MCVRAGVWAPAKAEAGRISPQPLNELESNPLRPIQFSQVEWPLAGGDGGALASSSDGAYVFGLYDIDGAASRKQVLPFLQHTLAEPDDVGDAAEGCVAQV